jgi:hypothetical protein
LWLRLAGRSGRPRVSRRWSAGPQHPPAGSELGDAVEAIMLAARVVSRRLRGRAGRSICRGRGIALVASIVVVEGVGVAQRSAGTAEVRKAEEVVAVEVDVAAHVRREVLDVGIEHRVSGG